MWGDRDVVKNEEEAPYHVVVDVEAIREQGRIEMWHQVTGRWLWGDHFDITRTLLRRTIEHRAVLMNSSSSSGKDVSMIAARVKNHEFFTWLMRFFAKESWCLSIRILALKKCKSCRR